MLVLACLRKIPGGTLQASPSSSPFACFGEWDGIFLPLQARRDLCLRGVRSPGNTARAITCNGPIDIRIGNRILRMERNHWFLSLLQDMRYVHG